MEKKIKTTILFHWCVWAKRKGFENEKHYRVGLLTTKSEIFKYADRSNYPSGKH
jgi:hypothetical protein